MCKQCAKQQRKASGIAHERWPEKNRNGANLKLRHALRAGGVIKLKFHDVRQPLWNLICAENMRRMDLITSSISKDQNPICQKLKNILTKTTLVKDVKKLSPVMQTSSLEGFHSVQVGKHVCFCLHVAASKSLHGGASCE